MPRASFEVPRADRGVRLDRWLAKTLAIPEARAKQLVERGMVQIAGKACSPVRKLFGGEEVVVDRPEPKAVAAPRDAPVLTLLHDDGAALVVNKPAGLAVEPSRAGGPSVLSAAAALGGRFDVGGRALPGLAHRLDKDTSGCLLLARTDLALGALKAAFEKGEVEKRYLALVRGDPPERWKIDTAYGRNPKDSRRYTTHVRSARRARLSFEVRERFEGGALLEVLLDTGRTHQIRVQLGESALPVLGDAIYGVRSPLIDRQALHAWKLSFPSPATGERVSVEAPLPADLLAALSAWRGEGESSSGG